MPSDFPGSPRLLKGALVVFEAFVPVPTNLIVFQYNPDQVDAGFQQAGGGGAGAHPTRVAPPATRGACCRRPRASRWRSSSTRPTSSRTSNPLAVATGLHPTLAALELLLYPPSTQLILDKVLAKLGSARVSPAKVPLVLLVWGPLRVLPVRVESVTITEQAFDPLLNPIRAKVDLGLRTLSPSGAQGGRRAVRHARARQPDRQGGAGPHRAGRPPWTEIGGSLKLF